MKVFLETKLGLVFDGVWQMREILFLLAAAAFCLLLLAPVRPGRNLAVILALAAQLIQRIVNSRKLKKDTIFSHRKNKYKDGIGKRRNRKY